MVHVSAVITAFNEGGRLARSVESLLSQTHRDLEIIVIDDGSSDHPEEILAPLLRDPRLRLIRQANAGLSMSRSAALQLVRGDYVCFLDADDQRPCWAIADMVARLGPDCDLVISRGFLKEYDQQPRPFYDDVFFNEIPRHGPEEDEKSRFLALLCEPQSANKLVATAMIRQCKIGFPSSHYYEDLYFHMLCVIHARAIAFCHSPSFVYYRRYNKNQITSGSGRQRFDVISTSSVLLDLFSRSGYMASRRLRSALMASVLRLVNWCESMLEDFNRREFHGAVRAMFALQSPVFREVDFSTIPDPGRQGAAVEAARYYGIK